MSEWKNIKDELPPIGKKVLVDCDNQLRIMTLGYSWQSEEKDVWPKIATEEQLKSYDTYWLLIPERKK